MQRLPENVIPIWSKRPALRLHDPELQTDTQLQVLHVEGFIPTVHHLKDFGRTGVVSTLSDVSGEYRKIVISVPSAGRRVLFTSMRDEWGGLPNRSHRSSGVEVASGDNRIEALFPTDGGRYVVSARVIGGRGRQGVSQVTLGFVPDLRYRPVLPEGIIPFPTGGRRKTQPANRAVQ